jgi:iron complex outermembrane receptor protein
MKFIFGCLLTAFIGCFYNNLYAQVPAASIQGKVITETQAPAEAASIVLINSRDSSIVNAATVNNEGAFKFVMITPGSYLLIISKVGYHKLYAGPYQVAAGNALAVADIVLTPVTKQLSEVTVLSNRPAIEFKPGTVTLNVANSLSAAGSSAYDILKQSPGVRVDENSITIAGRQSALITIDGKPTNLTGDDLTGILRSMQAATIDKIELITGGSAKYDASGGGIINIVLKKGKNTGFNATYTATGGYGTHYKANTGITFNNRTDKFNVFGTYNYSNNENFHELMTNRIINDGGLQSNYLVDYNSLLHNSDNNFSFGTDYYISKTQTIGFFVNGDVRDDGITKNNNLKISNQGVPDSVITANSHLNRHISKLNYNVNYNGKLDDKGTTLSADFNYTTYDRSSAEFITNDFFNAAGDVYRDPLLLENLSPSKIRIWLSKIDFSDPLTKTSKLEAGFQYNNTSSDNNFVFGPLVDGQYQSDPGVSNHFIYTEDVTAGYVNYQNAWGRYELTTGLRAEQTMTQGNSVTANSIVSNNYLDFFPNARLSYKIDDKSMLSASYNRGILRPAYKDVNPFLYYIDLYDYSSGNPNLKPEYTNSVELTYSRDKSFSATLYSRTITNAYEFDFYQQNDATKVNVDIRENVGNEYNYGIRFIAPVTFTRWWNADFNVDASYQRYVAYPQNGNLDKGTQDIIFSSAQHFILGKTITAEISGRYETPTFYGINQFKSNYFVNAGIGKQLFNRRATLRLNVSDVFNTLRDRAHTDYQNLNLTTLNKNESQVARLTFTYRFGKSTQKATIHRTGNEDEQKRIGSGGDH